SAPWIVVATALSPSVVFLMRLSMAEVPMMLCLVALTERLARPDVKDSWRESVILAAICFVAFAFRTAAISMALGVGAWHLIHRQLKHLLRFTVLFGVPAGGLAIWLLPLARPAVGFEGISVYNMPYGLQLAGAVGHVPEIAWKNLFQGTF